MKTLPRQGFLSANVIPIMYEMAHLPRNNDLKGVDAHVLLHLNQYFSVEIPCMGDL